MLGLGAYVLNQEGPGAWRQTPHPIVQPRALGLWRRSTEDGGLAQARDRKALPRARPRPPRPLLLPGTEGTHGSSSGPGLMGIKDEEESRCPDKGP